MAMAWNTAGTGTCIPTPLNHAAGTSIRSYQLVGWLCVHRQLNPAVDCEYSIKGHGGWVMNTLEII